MQNRFCRHSCEHCGKKGFRSETSLHQHQSQNDACFAKFASDLGSQHCSASNKTKCDRAATYLSFGSVNPHSRPSFLDDFLCKPQKCPKLTSNVGQPNPNPGCGQPLRCQEHDNDCDMFPGTSDNDDAVAEDNLDHVDDSMHQQLQDCVKRSKEFIPFAHLDTTAVTFLTLCGKTKASLGTCESVLFCQRKGVSDVERTMQHGGRSHQQDSNCVAKHDSKMVIQSLPVEPPPPEDHVRHSHVERRIHDWIDHDL